MTVLTAGEPVEPLHHQVGRRTATLVDHERGGRQLGLDIWYPAADDRARKARYELLPGISFEAAAAREDAPAKTGRYPLILFSHGRTGTRLSYAMVCEALASRGAVVVSADHPGDALTDWLLGAHVDDRTNEVNRVGDAHFLLHALQHGFDELPVDVLNAIDQQLIVLAGHSYGAFTAFATAAGSRGVPAHGRVRAVVGYQAYTRTMSDGLIGRVRVPALLVVGELDTVTPAAVDADRPWALLPTRPTWRLDLAGATHQAISDISLYAELARHLPGLPDIAREYLESAAADARGAGARPWRELVRVQVAVTWAFLQIVLEIDPEAGAATRDRLVDVPGVSLRCR